MNLLPLLNVLLLLAALLCSLLLSSSLSYKNKFFVAADLTILHYTTFPDCTGPSVSYSYSQDSCVFGTAGRTSSSYVCNETHAISRVYTHSSDCSNPGGQSLMLTEATLGDCHKIISTSIKFMCSSAGRIGTGSVLISLVVVMVTSFFLVV